MHKFPLFYIRFTELSRTVVLTLALLLLCPLRGMYSACPYTKTESSRGLYVDVEVAGGSVFVTPAAAGRCSMHISAPDCLQYGLVDNRQERDLVVLILLELVEETTRIIEQVET
ncbi:hypothetical protein LSM04_007550 [Trypanosoma melophagium]|uniref:uncharacterized protein n=1 Tax=Trypanosoma melophagium TaxID=715481 RepID=UPI00351A4693|nr:hypothetical protein LSM04_007550 [Trypanosoma melophagium]